MPTARRVSTICSRFASAGHTRAVTDGAGHEPTLALEHEPETGLAVVGTGFPPGERVTLLVKTIGGEQQTVVDQDGAFRIGIDPVGGRAGTLWITADGDRGSSATLVLPRPSRLH